MRRVVRPELLDSGNATTAEIQGSFADLRLINRAFGGVSTTQFLLNRVLSIAKLTQASVLDVAAGNGDGSAAMQRLFATKLRCTLLDRKAAHLNGAAQKFPSVVADATALPFRDRSFDLVTCSLFAHHLEPEELHRFVEEALRASRVALLINDIRRSAVHLGLVYVSMPLYRSRVTRHDTIASVQRAYTPEEMQNMLRRSSARSVEVHETFLYRMGAIAWK
jgi:ubiquinone/menaquinone biosynthesis C-methylase UbiE